MKDIFEFLQQPKPAAEAAAAPPQPRILHEAPLTGGAGAEFAARIAEKAFDYLDAPIKRVAALDLPTPYSPPLEAAALPDKSRVLQAARELTNSAIAVSSVPQIPAMNRGGK